MVTKRKTTKKSDDMKSSCKSGKVTKKTTIRKTKLPSSPPDSPVRAIVCLKKINDMKRFEESEDCFILGFDPSELVVLSKLSLEKKNPVSAINDDVCVISEKGQVACRDYPHSRNLCLKFPFKTTPHASYCEMCYCYVCDSPAPCKQWTLAQHCNAENVGHWRDQRRNTKKQQPVAVATR